VIEQVLGCASYLSAPTRLADRTVMDGAEHVREDLDDGRVAKVAAAHDARRRERDERGDLALENLLRRAHKDDHIALAEHLVCRTGRPTRGAARHRHIDTDQRRDRR
jgi:hypothetical protein